jgi:hypothetical protein
MSRQSNLNEAGQSLVEYSLLLGLLVVIAVSGLASVGPLFGTQAEGIKTAMVGGAAPEDAASARRMAILDDILTRIETFQGENGRWPRSWGDYAYTDIGLNPADWQEAVEGIYWGPHGSDVGLANRKGDNIQIYVNDLNGKTRHLIDSWNIWCTTGGKCYYHRIAPENEVDIRTLVVKVEG